MRTTSGRFDLKTLSCGVMAGILTLFGFVSCGQSRSETVPVSGHTETEETETAPSYDLYVYRLENGPLSWNQDGMPYKVNLVSGKTTPVCTDPLCMHDSEECPFYECTGCAIDGEILFYRRGYLSRNENGYFGTEKLCACEVAEGKTRVLRDYADSLIFLGVHRDMLYYYTAEWEKEGEELVCTYHLHRADGKSGAIEDLSLPETYRTVGGFTDSRDYPRILSFDGDRILWVKTGEDLTSTLFRSGQRGEDWTELKAGLRTLANVYAGDWGYSLGISVELADPGDRRGGNNGTTSYSLTRTKLDSGEETREVIAEDIGSSNFLVTDRCIFTMEGFAPVPDGIKVKTDPFSFGADYGTEILNGCRVWRMNPDGSERTLVGEQSDVFFAGKQNICDKVLFDCYEDADGVRLAFFFMEKDENGKLILSEDTLILDTATGEFTVSEMVR